MLALPDRPEADTPCTHELVLRLVIPGDPQAKLAHTELCICGDRKRDHENLLGRCWVCGTGSGEGCQRFLPEAVR